MASSEWWCVEGSSGDSIDAVQYPNQEGADAVAQAAAERSGGPLVVVQYQRTEVMQYTRTVTVTATALQQATVA